MSIGIIEGFYGQPWGWEARSDAVGFFASHGLSFYVYAPKADAKLRRHWADPHPLDEHEALVRFADECRAHGVAFGIGLTPLGLHTSWDREGRELLRARLDDLDEVGPSILALLFDDMRGDVPRVAEVQAEMVDFAAGVAGPEQVWMCPTYYSDATILDLLYGKRPPHYLETLGRALDPAVGVFWTGEQIVSPSYTSQHLARVADELGRPPVLWDNYPVNDGPRMCRHLHLGAPDRPARLSDEVRAIAINPMNQPWLSRVPIRSMARSLRGAPPDDSFAAVLPDELAARLAVDAPRFQEHGLDEMQQSERDSLIEVYATFDHPAAAEVIEWLTGRTVVSLDVLTDM